MRVVVQRVKRASVRIGGELHSSIEAGLLILLGVEDSDESSDIEWLVKKCANLRIFDDENGVMNRSLIDMNGEVMIVSQFTLMASTKKGNRPSYIRAAGHEHAVPMYEAFCRRFSEEISKTVATGVFGADMQVELVNLMTIKEAQEQVDKWIKSVGVRYFSELTNMAILTEEVGEVARIISRRYGDQSFKSGEENSDLSDELCDVFWVLLCLANQTGVDLTSAFEKNMEKKTNRDKTRHINNPKLTKNG